MKKTALGFLTLVSVAAAIGGPALAQSYGPPSGPGPGPGAYHQDGDRDHRDGDRFERGGDRDHGGGWDIDRKIQWTQARITRGRDNGSLDRREFFRAQTELNRIRRGEAMARRYHDGRLDDRARFDLSARLDRLNGQIHWMRQNDERRPW